MRWLPLSIVVLVFSQNALALRDCNRYEACGVVEYTLVDNDDGPTIEQLLASAETDDSSADDVVQETENVVETTDDLVETVGNVTSSTTNMTASDAASVDGSGEGGLLDEVAKRLPPAPPPPAAASELVYDEVIERRMYRPPPPLNASVDSRRHFALCDCGGGDAVCPLENETVDATLAIRLDAYLELRLCQPMRRLFPRPCRGDRGVVRVIGAARSAANETMARPLTTLDSYNETLLFCHCAATTTYARVGTEPWKDGHFQAIKFDCSKGGH